MPTIVGEPPAAADVRATHQHLTSRPTASRRPTIVPQHSNDPVTGRPGPEQDTDLADELLDGGAQGVPDVDGTGEQAPAADGPLEDEELLDAVRAGDETSYGVLYQRHRSTALNVARMHTRNVQDAEDLVSEAFTRVLSVIRKGGGPQKFLRSYLVTTIGRLAVDHGVASTRVQPVGEHSELDGAEEFDDVVVRQCDAVAVAGAYASLPERWQAVLWHAEVEGMKPQAIAKVLGMTPNAVSALNKRARGGLQAAYLQAQVSSAATSQCPEIAADLGAFARGSLGSRARREVQQHLDSCPRCTAEYLQLQETGVGMRTWLLPALAALPLWGTESKVLAALMVSGGGTGAAAVASGAAQGTQNAAGTTGSTGGVAIDPTTTAAAADSSHGPSLFEGVVDDPPPSADQASGDASSAGSGANAGAVAGVVGAGVGLKVVVGAVAASAVVALVGVGFNTLVRDDGTNGSTTLGGLPFPAHEGPAEATEAAETAGATSSDSADRASSTPTDDSESSETVRVGLERSNELSGPTARSTEASEATGPSVGMSAFRNVPADPPLARSPESQAAAPAQNDSGATVNGVLPRSADQQDPATVRVPEAPRQQAPEGSGTTPGTGHAGALVPPVVDDTPETAPTAPTPDQSEEVPAEPAEPTSTEPAPTDPGTGEDDRVLQTSDPAGVPTDGGDSTRVDTPETQLPTDEPGPQTQDPTQTAEPAPTTEPSPSPLPTTDASEPTDGSTDSSGTDTSGTDTSTRDTTGGDSTDPTSDPTSGSDTGGYWVFTPYGWVLIG